jgi:hypothetical protein
MSVEMGRRLRTATFDEKVSSSAICEIAISQLFDRVSRDRLGGYLRKRGACLRRSD